MRILYRYAMRRAANGPVTERLEPEEPVFLRPVPPGDDETVVPQARNDQPLLFEFLYNHFQVGIIHSDYLISF